MVPNIVPTDDSGEDSDYSIESNRSLPPATIEFALPVPICRGARLVATAGPSECVLTQSPSKSRSALSICPPQTHKSCEMRGGQSPTTSLQESRSVLRQTRERMGRACADLARTDRQQRQRSSDDRPAKSSKESPACDGRHQWELSPNAMKTRSIRQSTQIRREPKPEVLVKDSSRRQRSRLAVSGSDGGNSQDPLHPTHSRLRQPPESCRRHLRSSGHSQSQSNLCVHRVQSAQFTPTAPARPAITATISADTGTVDTVRPPDLPPLPAPTSPIHHSRSPGSSTTSDTTKWAPSTPILKCDGSPRQSGSHITFATIPLQVSTSSSARQTRQKTREETSGQAPRRSRPSEDLTRRRGPCHHTSNEHLSHQHVLTGLPQHPTTPTQLITRRDMEEELSSETTRRSSAGSHRGSSPEQGDPQSPISWDGNDSDLDSPGEHLTPITSPETSPIKARPPSLRFTKSSGRLVQLDGGGTSSDETKVDEANLLPTTEAAIGGDSGQSHVQEMGWESPVSQNTFGAPAAPIYPKPQMTNRRVAICSASDDVAGLETPIDVESEHEITPPAAASSAKPLESFPVASIAAPPSLLTKQSPLRQPSALLQFCERNATPGQRRLMNSGITSPDRYVPSRAGTPSKAGLMLKKTSEKYAGGARLLDRSNTGADPFGSAPRRSLRMAEHFATVRNPTTPSISFGRAPTRVPDARYQERRAVSLGTIWTVGGSVVTEGVASTTNGRGGRVTSGSSATHYSADFLRRNHAKDNCATHESRLAVAMDLCQSVRLVDHSAQSSPTPSRSRSACPAATSRVFKDGNWMSNDPSSRLCCIDLCVWTWKADEARIATKVRSRKPKDIPVIPFRVLNAPSLRDDYYCSLLAYSPQLQCLAVGLGPHVYLWSEPRKPTAIPESLTAPYGSAHVTSVSFSSHDGGKAILAIGRADGRITLWSPLDRDPRFDSEQPGAVSCVSFRPNALRRQSVRDPALTVSTEELLVGDEVGFVYYYSVEWPDNEQRDLFDWHGSMTLRARISCHAQQVCRIAWSFDGEYFASGGNDNQLFLYERRKIRKPLVHPNANASVPVRVRNDSQNSSSQATAADQGEVLTITPGQQKHILKLNAAVKAIAFAPWQPSLLAAGGGSNDRCIHFFHTFSGASLATIDCYAQVTSLVWSTRRREIAATFGFAQPEHPYRIAVFSWPRCEMVVAIPWWSEERALYAVPYPRGPAVGVTNESMSTRVDAEGRPWYGRRTREEGCLVVATSDASIKFHEVWAESGGQRMTAGDLGGSQILEGECGMEAAIR